MILIFLLISLLYGILILSLAYGWKRIPEFRLQDLPAQTNFSVVIPYRNEVQNLPLLLRSLAELRYPPEKFELILVNDASEDHSLKICSDFKHLHPQLNIQLLNNKRTCPSPKKDALRTAVQSAAYEYIITADADCEVSPDWLRAYDEKIRNTGTKLVAGPVMLRKKSAGDLFSNENGLTQSKISKYFLNFQEQDFLSLQAAGAGGFGLNRPFMCNGANLCYEKKAFQAVNGFSGNESIAGGDDVFLLQKFAERKFPTTFLKSRSAIVTTAPQAGLGELISQRIRWAAKTPAYKSAFAKILGLTVFLMNLLLIIGAILTFLNLLPYRLILFVFLFKFTADLLLIYQAATFFDRVRVLRSYLWSSLLYPFFSTGVAFLSLFRGFEWKGRKFKR